MVSSALIRWNIGEIQWMHREYNIDDVGTFTVIDPDANLNSKSIDTFNVKIWSDSDKNGTKIRVKETGTNTGIFLGNIKFAQDTVDGLMIKVNSGDKVYVEYIDHTLPKPHTLGETMSIIDSTKIIYNTSKELYQIERKRRTQILNEFESSFKKLRSMMEGLQHWAKSRDLLITQHKDGIKKKNELIEKIAKLIENPLIVINDDLKKEMFIALELSRYKPAWERMDCDEETKLKQKKLDAGWKENYKDFDITNRLKDNDVQSAITKINDVIKKISSHMKSN